LPQGWEGWHTEIWNQWTLFLPLIFRPHIFNFFGQRNTTQLRKCPNLKKNFNWRKRSIIFKINNQLWLDWSRMPLLQGGWITYFGESISVSYHINCRKIFYYCLGYWSWRYGRWFNPPVLSTMSNEYYEYHVYCIQCNI